MGLFFHNAFIAIPFMNNGIFREQYSTGEGIRFCIFLKFCLLLLIYCKNFHCLIKVYIVFDLGALLQIYKTYFQSILHRCIVKQWKLLPYYYCVLRCNRNLYKFWDVSVRYFAYNSDNFDNMERCKNLWENCYVERQRKFLRGDVGRFSTTQLK